MSDWVDVNNDSGSDWQDVGPVYKPSALETFASSMSPKGITSAVYGAREAIPDLMTGDYDKALETYRRERDSARKDLESSEDYNKRAAMLGSAVPYVVGGLAGTPGVVGNAVIGGLSSGVDSKADLTNITDINEAMRLAKDVGIGAGLGATLGAAAKFAPKSTGAAAGGAIIGSMVDPENGAIPGAAIGLGLRGATSPAVRNYLTQKFTRTVLGVPEASSQRYLANPDRVNAAKDLPGVAEDVAGMFNKVKGEIPELAESATANLRGVRTTGEGGIPLQQVIGELDSILSGAVDADKLSPIQKIRDDLVTKYAQRAGSVDAAFADNLTEQEVKSVVKALQAMGDYSSPLLSQDKAMINQAGGRVNAILKANNPEYAAQVAKVKQKIDLKEALVKKFGIGRSATGDYVATDRTISALKDLAKAGKIDRAGIARELKDAGLGDLTEQVLDSITKESFNKQFTQGSRNVNLGALAGGAVQHAFTGAGGTGAAIGGVIGGYPGMFIGGAAGAAVDAYGPRMGKRVLDAAGVINNLQSKVQSTQAFQKYVVPLQQALSSSVESFGARYYLLQQSDPEFRKLVSEDENR